MERNTLECADALDYLRGLPDESVDMFLTSPPYDHLRRYEGYSWDFKSIAPESFRVLKSGGVMVWVVGDSIIDGSESLTSFKQAIYFKETVGYRIHDTMIWRKVIPGCMGKRYNHAFEYMFVLSKGEPLTFNPCKKRNGRAFSMSGGGVRTIHGWTGQTPNEVHEIGLYENIWDMGAGNNGDDRTGHPAPFPEELARRHILTWTNAGELVCDFFMGSGTTAKIARVLGRDYIGCDLSPAYVAMAQARLAVPYTLPMEACL